MADEEVRDQNFCEQIKTSTQKQACHQHLTLFFHPPPAVDVYERPWGSDRLEVGRVGKVTDDAMMEGRGNTR
jgi:hypothetical protein